MFRHQRDCAMPATTRVSVRLDPTYRPVVLSERRLTHHSRPVILVCLGNFSASPPREQGTASAIAVTVRLIDGAAARAF